MATARQGQSVATDDKEILASPYRQKHENSTVCRKECPALDLETPDGTEEGSSFKAVWLVEAIPADEYV